ncbi:hypothetical protein WN093_00380 [Gammaproteobacteria bacterium AS21]
MAPLTSKNHFFTAIVLLGLTLLTSIDATLAQSSIDGDIMVSKVQGKVTQYKLPWGNTDQQFGSTHELIFNPNGGKYAWVTGQNYDKLARVNIATGTVNTFSMPKGSGPHGVTFNENGDLWVSLEFAGLIVQIDTNNGRIIKQIDVHMALKNSAIPINPAPHAIEFAADGKTIWFTGKRTSSVGKIDSHGAVSHYPLLSLGAVPIYLLAAADGSMWGTLLASNKILHVTNQGAVTEYTIASYNSRPIAIVQAPDQQSIWFSQEASHKVAKIDSSGNISEYRVPKTQDNMLLAGLAFDHDGNLWTQSYVDQNNPYHATPTGHDYIIKLSNDILSAPANDMTSVITRFYQVPSKKSVFHRIKLGTDGNIWFTQLAQDNIGKVIP